MKDPPQPAVLTRYFDVPLAIIWDQYTSISSLLYRYVTVPYLDNIATIRLMITFRAGTLDFDYIIRTVPPLAIIRTCLALITGSSHTFRRDLLRKSERVGDMRLDGTCAAR